MAFPARLPTGRTASEGKPGRELYEIQAQLKSYMSKIVKLVNLSPEIQKMIMEGTEPESLPLAKLRHEIPARLEGTAREVFGVSILIAFSLQQTVKWLEIICLCCIFVSAFTFFPAIMRGKFEYIGLREESGRVV